MRELLVVPPESVKRAGRARKVQFGASGAELAVWVNHPKPDESDVFGLYRCDLASGTSTRLLTDRWYWLQSESDTDTLLSPDLRWAVDWYTSYDDNYTGINFTDTRNPIAEPPKHEFPSVYCLPLFVPDGSALVAAHLDCSDESACVSRVGHLDITRIDAPARTVRKRSPIPGERPIDLPVWNFKWKQLLAGVWERPTCAALSANGRFLAVADEPGNVHVADLKRKRVVAVHQKARLTVDRVIGRVAVDDTGERVFRTANGVLHGPNWQFKPPSGKPTDFALCPDQSTVCAVFDSGHARTFDAATGAVRKELRWGKKPLYSVCFAPDGLTCAAGSANGRVILWDVDG